MKANAPEKIYVHVRANKELGTTWHGKKITNGDIEYIRTDAFIEKACEFLDGVIYDYIELKYANVNTFIDVDNKRFIEDFRNHMKGE